MTIRARPEARRTLQTWLRITWAFAALSLSGPASAHGGKVSALKAAIRGMLTADSDTELTKKIVATALALALLSYVAYEVWIHFRGHDER